MTEIYELGESVPLENIHALRDRMRNVIHKYQAITLSGSLPPGVPPDFYGNVIEIAKEAGVLTFLDTSGEALQYGIESRPFFVKPNETEARSLLGLDANEPFDFAQAAAEIAKKYQTNVLLSLGAEGAVTARADDIFIAKSPRVEAISAVGSGDCTLAGLVYGILREFSFEEAIVCGVAAGTANTLTIGAGQFKIDNFERLRGQVRMLKS